MNLERFGIRTVRFLDRLTDIVIAVALCAMLLFGAYSIWDSHQIDRQAAPLQYAAYRPDADDSAGFEELRVINPEVIAWLTVIGTPIDYPVTQGQDNEKYINTDAKNDYTLSGSLFLDYRNSPDFDDFKSVIYGHHMANERMFGALSNFAERDYFDAHPYGDLFFNGRNHGIAFFALVLTDAYDDLLFDPAGDDRANVLDTIRSKAVFLRQSVSVTTEDPIIVLSTCTTDITNGRYMLIGKLTDEIFLTPEDAPRANRGTGLTDPAHRLLGIPVWGWIAAVVMMTLLTVLAIRFAVSRKRLKNKGRES